MLVEGKGLYIWKIHRCQNGDPAAIARRAMDAGLTHVLIKIADGRSAYNVDLAERVSDSLKGAGIEVWGWQFVYGDEPFREADIAYHRIKTLGLDGFVVNAENDYLGKFAEAMAYMERLRSRLPDLPIGLSSFRYPHYHPQFPWTEFLTHCDVNMPQVYWVKSNNPAEQLDRCQAQFQAIYPVRPIIPTGAAYAEYGWRPTTEEVVEFLRHARKVGFPAVNFWNWDYAGSPEGDDLWHVMAAFKWPVATPARDIALRLFDLLNKGGAAPILPLYRADAVLVTADKVFRGRDEVRGYYVDLLANRLPAATFRAEIAASEGPYRHVRWDAFGAANGRTVTDGQDTLGLREGLIQFHTSIYRIG